LSAKYCRIAALNSTSPRLSAMRLPISSAASLASSLFRSSRS
jgi:hypothetical protein